MYELPRPEELRKYRLSLRMTQTALAKDAGVSQSLIARIEAGDIDPKLSTLRKILTALKEHETKKGLFARDAMTTAFISMSPDDTLAMASNLMEKNSISQVPVIEDDIQLGSITEEAVVKVIDSAKDPSKIMNKKVNQFMEPGFPTVSTDTRLDTVSKILEANSAILVMDTGKPVGIVTKADIIKLRLAG